MTYSTIPNQLLAPVGLVTFSGPDNSKVATDVPAGHGTAATAVRVELASDGTGLVNAAQSGTWTVGLAASQHVIIDTGSTTAVTGNVTVTQGTGANLHTVIDSGTISLPSGAASSAKQPALGSAGTPSADVISVQGVASGTAIPVSLASTTLTGNNTVVQATGSNLHTVIDSGTLAASNLPATVDTNSGVKSASTLRVVLATDQPALTNKLLVTPDSVALPANQTVNVSQINGATTVNGGTAAGILAVGGPNATNVAITGNPVNNGAQAVSSENAAVTTARQVQLVADLVGKLIVLPYANPENFVSGTIATAMTGTTSTSLMAAPAAGLRNYVTQVTVSNSHATVGTDVILQDGSGGTTLYVIPASAAYGGATITFPAPLRQPTTATALYCANVTTGSSIKVSASGYKGA